MILNINCNNDDPDLQLQLEGWCFGGFKVDDLLIFEAMEVSVNICFAFKTLY